ncbi:MAG: 4Fe-4S domain-containing protein [bacterium]
MFTTAHSTVEKSTDAFWPEFAESNSIANALGQALAHFREILEFFRAVHIAKLEVQNKYREDKHDRYFAAFDFSKLTADEAALLPPYIVRIKAKNLDEIDRSSLVDLLASDLPIKILLTIEELCEGEMLATGAIEFSGWTTRLAEIARSTNKSFVLQTASSNLSHLIAGFKDGLHYDGPALFCVYTGSNSNSSQLSPYLQSAAALESRILPAFTFNPSAGDTSAENFTIASTPQFDKDWPVNALTYEDAEGQETTQDLTFTLSDFLATDPRFARHFLPVSRENWCEQMIPVAAFVENFQANLGQKIPFILIVADDGTLYRVVVSYAIAAAAVRCLRDWRSLQELGGVNNSHAQRLLQREKARLEEEKQQEIKEIEAKHQETLDRAVGEVAQEIVSNIAAGLLDQGSVAPEKVTFPDPTPMRVEPAPSIAETPEERIESVKDEEDETETLSLDEPYIETVRCTTCNECTMINPQMFAYNAEKQAYIKDINAGTYRNLVESAEKCPVRIIHPGKPVNPDEPGLEDLLKRAEPFL